jgi:integrase
MNKYIFMMLLLQKGVDMATITKRKDRQWQVKVRRKGTKQISKTFPTKVLAQQWARQVEHELDTGRFTSTNNADKSLVGEILQRYLEEEVPKKKSYADYKSRIKILNSRFGHKLITALTSSMIREFRDERLDYVKSETVRKDIGMLGRIIKHAISEWDINLPLGNPVNTVKLPPKGKSRKRRLSNLEEQALLDAAREYGGVIESAIGLAIETAARRGELHRLRWEDIDFNKSTALLLDTKNGEDREIPLSDKAVDILKNLPRNMNSSIFNVRADSISQAFRRICKRIEIDDLWFHDLRHEATSRLFEMGLDIMEVSSITGHKDLRMLRNYTHLKAENLALKIREKETVI